MHGLSGFGHKLDVELARHELAAARAHLSRGADGSVQLFKRGGGRRLRRLQIRLQLVEGIAEPLLLLGFHRGHAGGRRGLEQALADVGALPREKVKLDVQATSKLEDSLVPRGELGPHLGSLRVELLNLVAIRLQHRRYRGAVGLEPLELRERAFAASQEYLESRGVGRHDDEPLILGLLEESGLRGGRLGRRGRRDLALNLSHEVLLRGERVFELLGLRGELRHLGSESGHLGVGGGLALGSLHIPGCLRDAGFEPGVLLLERGHLALPRLGVLLEPFQSAAELVPNRAHRRLRRGALSLGQHRLGFDLRRRGAKLVAREQLPA